MHTYTSMLRERRHFVVYLGSKGEAGTGRGKEGRQIERWERKCEKGRWDRRGRRGRDRRKERKNGRDKEGGERKVERKGDRGCFVPVNVSVRGALAESAPYTHTHTLTDTSPQNTETLKHTPHRQIHLTIPLCTPTDIHLHRPHHHTTYNSSTHLNTSLTHTSSNTSSTKS